MSRARVVLLSLAVWAVLAGCAATAPGRDLRGESGPIVWEVVDVRQRLVDNGVLTRWEYTVVLRNRGVTVVAFDRVALASRARGTGDLWGGLSDELFDRRLEPNRELRFSRTDTWGCPRCGPSELHTFFASGIIRDITFSGRDAQGEPVKVLVRIPLNSSVGKRE
jgi:hypothetical protein